MKPICCWLIVACLGCLRAFAQDYEIQLHRPLHDGDRYKSFSTGRIIDNSSKSIGGKVAESSSSDVSVHLEGVGTVLTAMDGHLIKESLIVTKFTRTENGTTKTLLSGGATVVSWREGGKSMFTVDGRAASAEEAHTLFMVSGIDESRPNADAIFGTKERKKVGDSWPADAKLLVQTINANQPRVTSASGKVTLKEVVKETSGPILVINIDLNDTPTIPLPPGGVIDRAAHHSTYLVRLPVDLHSSQQEDSSIEDSLSIHAKALQSPDGPEIVLDINNKMSKATKRTLIR